MITPDDRRAGVRRGVRFFPRLSLRHRVMLVLFLLIVAMVILHGGVQIYQEYRVMTAFLGDSSASFADCVTHACEPAIRSGDARLLQAMVLMAQRQHTSDLSYVLVQDASGAVRASTDPSLIGSVLDDPVSRRALAGGSRLRQDVAWEPHPLYAGAIYDISAPIAFPTQPSGIVRVGVSSSGISRRIREGILTGVGILLIALVVGGGMAFWVDRHLGLSLQELSRTARRMAGGDLSARAEIRTGDELQVLGETLNRMACDLASAQDVLRQWGGQMEERVRSRTRELEEERQKLDGIVRGIGAGLVLVDSDLRVIWTNAAMPDGIAVPPCLPAAPCHRVLWNEREPCVGCASQRVFQSGRIEQCEKEVRDGSSRRRHFQITSSPIRDPSGRVVQALELIQDVSAKKQMESQLVQAGKMVAMGELAASIAHEVNNPLAVIGAHADRMREALRVMAGPLPGKLGKFPDYLDAVERHVFRCKGIITRLLNFARRKEMDFQRTNLAAVLRDAIALVEHTARIERKEIAFDASPDVPPVMTDPDGVGQVGLNLISNALDAIPEGQCVQVSLRCDGVEVVLSVADRGTGIPRDQLPRLFEPFYTTKPAGKGTGLGLAISARIVERLGGRLSVRSRPGEGTTFEVRFPFHRTPGESDAS